MKLTKQQVEALRLLEVAPRETSASGGGRDDGRYLAHISGQTGKALGLRGLATSRGILPTVWTITDLGREVLAELEGQGRQVVVEVSIEHVRLRVTQES